MLYNLIRSDLSYVPNLFHSIKNFVCIGSREFMLNPHSKAEKQSARVGVFD
jgi:hypothetical protein